MQPEECSFSCVPAEGHCSRHRHYPDVRDTPPPMMATCGLLASTGAGTDVIATATATTATKDTTASCTIARMCRCDLSSMNGIHRNVFIEIGPQCAPCTCWQAHCDRWPLMGRRTHQSISKCNVMACAGPWTAQRLLHGWIPTQNLLASCRIQRGCRLGVVLTQWRL